MGCACLYLTRASEPLAHRSDCDRLPGAVAHSPSRAWRAARQAVFASSGSQRVRMCHVEFRHPPDLPMFGRRLEGLPRLQRAGLSRSPPWPRFGRRRPFVCRGARLSLVQRERIVMPPDSIPRAAAGDRPHAVALGARRATSCREAAGDDDLLPGAAEPGSITPEHRTALPCARPPLQAGVLTARAVRYSSRLSYSRLDASCRGLLRFAKD